MFYTYVLKSSLDNIIFYIGKGKGNRMFRHVSIAKGKSKNKLTNPKLYNKINFILKNDGYIIPEIIFESKLEKDCLDYEINKIKEIGLCNLTNLTIGGEGTSGYKLSDETKKKISESKKGKKIHTKESKKKISLKLKGKKRNTPSFWKGKKLSIETKQKMSDAKIGRKLHKQTKETKKKISETMKMKNTIQ